MQYISRRGLLAAGTSLTALGAGCFDRLSNDKTDESDETGGSDWSDLSPLERWVPASGSSELLFHYRDLTAVRQYEDVLRADVVESVPTLPDGESSEFVEQVTDGERAVDSVCRFGSEGVVGNVVVSGSFDPGAVDAELESAAGDFDSFERNGISVAVSEETVVVSPSDGAGLEAILAAGVEGTDRRIESDGNFASMGERISESTFVWGEHEQQSEDGTNGVGAAYSWSLGAETVTYSVVAAYPDPDRTDEFESEFGDSATDMTVEVDGNVGVATKTSPTEEYEFQDLFAERGSEPTGPYAGASIDTDWKSNAVVVMYHSSGNADRLEVRDEDGVRAELTEVGETATLEYESGASGTVTVVAIKAERETVILTDTYSF